METLRLPPSTNMPYTVRTCTLPDLSVSQLSHYFHELENWKGEITTLSPDNALTLIAMDSGCGKTLPDSKHLLQVLTASLQPSTAVPNVAFYTCLLNAQPLVYLACLVPTNPTPTLP